MIDDVLYKALVGSKPLHIRFDEMDEFIRVYGGTRYSTLFALKNIMLFTVDLEILLAKKSVTAYVFFHIIMQKSKVIPIILYL